MGARNGSEVLAFESLLKVNYVVNVIGQIKVLLRKLFKK